MQIPELEPLGERKPWMNAFFYGHPGGGKTTSAASMANLGPILYVNAEGGLEPVPLRKLGIKIDNIQVYPKPGEPLIFEELDLLVHKVRADLRQDRDAWAGVVFDSTNEMHIQLKDANVDRHKAQWRAQNRKFTDFEFNEQPSYGVMVDQMRRLIRGLRDAPCHFAMVSAIREPKTGPNVGKWVPDINPALQTELLGHQQIAAWVRVAHIAGTTLYIADTVSQRKYVAKDRLGVLPSKMPNPTFERMFQYMTGELTKANDPDYIAMLALRAAQQQ